MTPGQRLELRQASMHVVEGHSLVIPLIIEGLPAEIEVLGRRWVRKREFHLTVLAARVIDGLGASWDAVVEVASGRGLGPVQALDEARRATHPEKPELQTLIIMALCPGLKELYDDLARRFRAPLAPPPTHVTLYSTDAAEGIGMVDERELASRAPPLAADEEAAVRRAMRFP